MDEKLPTVHIAIIGGSSLLKSSLFSNLKKRVIPTPFGPVLLHIDNQEHPRFVFCQRHIANPSVEYSPPYLINKKGIIHALTMCGVKDVIAFGSVGSLQQHLPIGSLVIADDFYSPWDVMTFFEDRRGELVPDAMENHMRKEIMDVLRLNKIEFYDGGTYVQTHGPRFETRAEVKFLSTVGDIIGMTAAHEAILCGELGLKYCLICMVDNMANGLLKEKLTLNQFHAGVANNLKVVETVLGVLVQHFIFSNYYDQKRELV